MTAPTDRAAARAAQVTTKRTDLDQYVAEVVAKAPPLTAEQKARLRLLLAPAIKATDSGTVGGAAA